VFRAFSGAVILLCSLLPHRCFSGMCSVFQCVPSLLVRGRYNNCAQGTQSLRPWVGYASLPGLRGLGRYAPCRPYRGARPHLACGHPFGALSREGNPFPLVAGRACANRLPSRCAGGAELPGFAPNATPAQLTGVRKWAGLCVGSPTRLHLDGLRPTFPHGRKRPKRGNAAPANCTVIQWLLIGFPVAFHRTKLVALPCEDIMAFPENSKVRTLVRAMICG
jgi:hypothetical protein